MVNCGCGAEIPRGTECYQCYEDRIRAEIKQDAHKNGAVDRYMQRGRRGHGKIANNQYTGQHNPERPEP